jgi:hypothetical protein
MESLRRLFVLLLAVVLVLTACGGDDDSAGQTISTVTTSTTTVTTSTTTAPSEEGGGDGDLSGLFTGQCQEAAAGVAAAMSAYSTNLAGVFTGQVDEQQLQETADELQQMAEAAPDELKDELDIVAGALADFYQALVDIGIDPLGGETPTPAQLEQLAQLSEQFDQSGFQEAIDTIDAWFEANCS